MSTDIQTPLLSRLASELSDAHAKSRNNLQHPDIQAQIAQLNSRVQTIYVTIARARAGEISKLLGNEWLLDNDYVIQEALEQVKTDLPANFYRELVVVENNEKEPITRAEALVRATLAATELPIDMLWLEQFVAIYQQHHVLNIGEIWALPALLRLVILEEFCDSAAQLVGISAKGGQPSLECGDLIAGCVLTLNAITHFHWPDSVERLSRVDEILRHDPVGAYAIMDFPTRNNYRTAVEQIARRCKCSELKVAESAIYLATTASEDGPSKHVGYLLIGLGRPELERTLGYRPTPRSRLNASLRHYMSLIYVSSIVGGGIILLSLLFVWLQPMLNVNQALLLTVLGIPPALLFTGSLLNWMLTHSLAPKILPKMDFQKGIGSDWKTAVAVPVLLTSPAELTEILASLEINYLGNNDPLLQYILLSDFADAEEPELPGEDALLELASRQIEALNERYGNASLRPFHLMHRQRQWNPSEECWMGWERKRGKLAEFNTFLLEGIEGSFIRITGMRDQLRNISLVICLDADTHLTAGSARKMVGALAHPLNRPLFDPVTGRVTSGYTIIQPRLEINPVGANQTWFSKIFTGDITYDLYTRAVSNVYQDTLNEGIFVGKGIYDLEGFTASVEGQLPENSILSHDLLEGLHGRAALASDIVLFEDFPKTLVSYMRRQHRWIRGDWQLCPWMGWSGAQVGTHRARFRPKLIDRWKILDNLSRSLLFPCLLALLLCGWVWLPEAVLQWTALVALVPGLPILLQLFAALRPANWHWGTIRSTVAGHGKTLFIEASRWGLILAFLPYQSMVALDAIFRTLHRLLFRHKHLLEWTSAAQIARQFSGEMTLLQTWKEIYPSSLFAVAAGLLLWAADPAALPLSVPFLLVWLFAPMLAWWVSQPYAPRIMTITAEDADTLRLLARRTWHFFETFVNPESQWLPPDNIQQKPKFVVAQRTSPSNIGFAMLSTLSAYDFGYIGINNLCARLGNTLNTLSRAPTHRGHYLNWIKTTDLEPLEPHYISTVDSGNLAGCLIALAEGLAELRDTTVPSPQRRRGMHDTAGAMQSVIERHEKSSLGGDLEALKEAISNLLPAATADHLTWQLRLSELESSGCNSIEDHFLTALKHSEAHWSAEEIAEFRGWISCLNMEIQAASREYQQFMPWLPLLREIPALCTGDAQLTDDATGLRANLQQPRTLAQLTALATSMQSTMSHIDELIDKPLFDKEQQIAQRWRTRLQAGFEEATIAAESNLALINRLSAKMSRIVEQMDFRFLYDRKRELFRIGYNASSGELDTSYYDLLASEARLASFIAIAHRQVPTAHWVHLGRPLTRIGSTRVLLSWSATMFEYLMPSLLMECPARTLLNESSRTAIEQAMDYGNKNSVPWGISESGYYRFDHDGNYQYQAFGLPRLGLSRTHDKRLVVAPYASVLALPYAGSAVVENLQALRELGMEDQFGMHEALDYGLTSGFRTEVAGNIVGSYMSHHQGMIMLALGNALLDNPMVRRFHANPRIASVKPLLYEAVPLVSPVIASHPHRLEAEEEDLPYPRVVKTWQAEVRDPAINVLSNSHLNTRITSQGGGAQYWNDIALTCWEPVTDGTLGGLNFYFRDIEANTSWSLGGEYSRDAELSVEFGPHMAMFLLHKQALLTRLTVSVAAHADVEIRKLIITNESAQPRSLFVSMAGEPVMTSYEEYRRHPAFSRLFIDSEVIANSNILMFHRRPRSAGQEKLYMGYSLVTHGARSIDRYCENDRRAFVGQRGDQQRPDAVTEGRNRSSEHNATTDPWMALGASFELAPHDTIQLTFLTAVGNSQPEVLDNLSHFQSQERIAWTINQARTHSHYDLQLAGLEPEDPQIAMELLARICWPETASGDKRHGLINCKESQETLWRHGISGDHPIVLMFLGDSEHLNSAAQILRCYTYWNLRGIAIDLIFVDETSMGYSQPIRDRLRNLIDQSQEHHLPFKGRTAVIASATLSPEDRYDLIACSAVYLRSGASASSLLRPRAKRSELPSFVPVPATPIQETPTPPVPPPEGLLFNNGYGGFSPDGREYIMHQTGDNFPPAPWVNVLANPEFGCLTSSAGLDFTWYKNSSEYRLTRWHNDPVTEKTSEALYLRDEETAALWSPTPLPANDGRPYQVSHGAGYTHFAHNSNGLRQDVRVFVDPHEPVKIVQLKLTNLRPRDRRLTATYAAEWVMGNSHADNAGLLVPSIDADTQAILIRNGFARHHSERVGFVAASVPPHGITTDLGEFLGKHRSWRNPAGLNAIGLSDYVAPGQEICSAYQAHIDLPAHASTEIHFILGAGDRLDDALKLIRRFQNPAYIEERWAKLETHWNDILGRVQIHTPDPAIDLLINRWLLYQVLSSRLWGRTGFYQPGGAFGFRDQLQDVLALLATQPHLALEQILRAAAVQFEDGDVLHWWHTEPLRGVRTRCSDDLLWLPYAVAEYVGVTGNEDLLHQQVAWLDGAPLEAEEDERYAEFMPSDRTASIYEHCCRAIDARTVVGAHDLPLIGTGDWNDGLNRMGIDGKGESVWMAWFLCYVIDRFAPVCEQQGDAERATSYRAFREQLAAAANANGWDEEWYLRGYYDDGDALGSAANKECRIDLNAQTWAVISGAGQPERSAQGMQSVQTELVDQDNKLIRLLTPAFQKTIKDPGYIKGYPPGMRENGGQYNHAAVWAAWAMADTGAADKAMEWCQWLAPINRSTDRSSADHYRIEPYVMPGDICSGDTNAGRGGWSWYSGSAAWYYRLVVEQLVGLKWSSEGFEIAPCLPADWPQITLRLKHRDTTYTIIVEQPGSLLPGEIELMRDGKVFEGNSVAWQNDGQHHEIVMRPQQTAASTLVQI